LQSCFYRYKLNSHFENNLLTVNEFTTALMDKDLLQELTEKIIATKSFGRSKSYAKLLRYLVECSANDGSPKETTIAYDVFDKSNYDPAESTFIRVYLYNLRGKLDKYYSKEGKHDETILSIPKGHYKIELSSKQKSISRSKFNYPPTLFILILVLSLLINLGMWVKFTNNQTPKSAISDSEIWADILHSELPLSVFVGDQFLYRELNSKLDSSVFVRNPQINSKQELDTFNQQQPESHLKRLPVSFGFHISNSSTWIKTLTQLFSAENKHFTIGDMSRFNKRLLPNNDFIVIGMLKTLGIFTHYPTFSRSSVESLQHKNEDGKAATLYTPKGEHNSYHTDYGFFGKLPGPNNNTIFIFGGLFDSGPSQSLKNFTDKKSLQNVEKALKDKFGYIPKYFEVIFEVNGLDRMELDSKILHLDEVIPESDLAIWKEGK